MSTIDDIAQGKIDTVRIKRSADGPFQISAVDQTPEASATFQSIAKKVIAEAKHSGETRWNIKAEGPAVTI